ncbi:hypothetical protein IJT93_05205, partial [bacterium]|nr:hypothetical protein [bacterium]
DQGKTCFMGVRGIVRFLRFPHVPIIKACIEKGPAKKDFSFFHSPFFLLFGRVGTAKILRLPAWDDMPSLSFSAFPLVIQCLPPCHSER